MPAMQTNIQRNWKFDFLKGISCIIVVFLHCRHFLGIVGDIIGYSCRFPVPLFFMISGYYCYTKDRVWIKKKAFSILKLLLLAELFYGLWNCLHTLLLGEISVIDYLKELPVFEHPVRILFYGTLFEGVLWYLYAAFWTYCILYVFWNRNNVKKMLYLLIPVLLGLQIGGRFYWQNHFDINADVYLFRSALLFGLPLTLYGSLLAKLEAYIKERINWLKSILIVILGGILMTAEYFISRQYMDFHLSTVFTSTGFFLLAMTYPFAEARWMKCISYIGHRLSMLIYLSHIFFVRIVWLIAIKCGLESTSIFLWGAPIFVCSCSGVFAFLVNSTISRIRGPMNN